jgi:hypothetical protein
LGVLSHAERRRAVAEIADTAIHERQAEVVFLMQDGGVGRDRREA